MTETVFADENVAKKDQRNGNSLMSASEPDAAVARWRLHVLVATTTRRTIRKDITVSVSEAG